MADDGCGAASYDRDNIEAGLPPRSGRDLPYIFPGGRSYFPPLRKPDGLLRSAELLFHPITDLDENQHIPFFPDDVDLASARAEIALDDPDAVSFKESAGGFFRFGAGVPGGSGWEINFQVSPT